MRYSDLLLSLGASALIYGFMKLFLHRRKFKDLPKPPHSFFWGHLKLFGETLALFPPMCHPQVAITHLRQQYNLPEFFYIDLWPLGPVFLVSTTVEAMDHIDTRLSMGKHKENQNVLEPIVGKDSIPALNGRVWQEVHRMLQPAFQPQTVKKILAKVAEESAILRDVLDKLAGTSEVFSMEVITGRTVFDINSQSIIGISLNAQKGDCQILEDLTVPAAVWQDESNTWNPVKKLRLWSLRTGALKRSERWVADTIRTRYHELKSQDIKSSKNILDSCLIGRIQSEEQGLKPLSQDKAWTDLLLVNLRALLFAGQGTTNDTVLFILMLLSTHPECLQAIRDEHDRIAGPHFSGAVDLLTNQPQRTTELEYTTGVIKEALRLYPVGFTAKKDDKTSDKHIEFKGKRYPTFGQEVMLSQVNYIIHYDPTQYPNPQKFEPIRWTSASPYPPPENNAFRSFSKGARACMGRELAMDEMRGMLLCIIRWFDFEIADLKPSKTQRVPWMDLDLKLGDLAFQELAMEAKPRGGVMMRVKRTEKEW